MTLRAELPRLLRFGAVGVTNTMITVSVFAILTHYGLPAPLASAVGFAVGAVNGYWLNRAWTFASTAHGGGVVARYVGIQALGAGASAGGIAAVIAALALARIEAEGMVLPCVTVMTYGLTRALFA